MMSEGHVEDYFGAWCEYNQNEDPDVFNPDDNHGILFDVP